MIEENLLEDLASDTREWNLVARTHYIRSTKTTIYSIMARQELVMSAQGYEETATIDGNNIVVTKTGDSLARVMRAIVAIHNKALLN